ncbi:MAG: NADH-quinone oxidoreductase subunit M [Chloroflexi bacterium]|nr:NADH-quinone oxidoreductase subunit M [Chloroflexota bacterium]MCC6896721.1 NADH-quinone oxidoreductase subunit M [Anaerolineae bacterium]
MAVFGIDVLTFLLLATGVAGAIVLLLPNNKQIVRWTALGLSILIGAFCVAIFANYNREAGADQFQMVVNVPWFSLVGASWHLGIDGVSAAMILLTGLLTPLAVLISFEIEERVNVHMALLLFFEMGLLGVFVAMDLMIFFLFYELSIVPIYFIINQWGGPNRKYASTKFFIYSIGGSLGMLLAMQMIGWSMSQVPANVIQAAQQANPAIAGYVAGSPSFDIPTISAVWPNFLGDGAAGFLGIPIQTVKALAFLGFFVAFCIKVPVWPFHTWLPDAHSEAPTAGSMLLAGVMLKLGAYGFLRLVIPFFPDVWIAPIDILGAIQTNWAGIFAFLAMLSIVLGAFAAFGQTDIKRLVAYSSVNHMGFVAMGLAVAALAYAQNWQNSSTEHMQSAIIATNGAVMQMFNHGLTSAAMFLLAGAIYHKTHTRDMTQYGGFWVKAPVYGAIFIFTSMASLGLPGLNGFVSEFLVVRGAWSVFTWLTIISMIGLLFTGGYILKGIRAVLHGPFNMHWKDYNLEIELREAIAIAPLLVLILVTGLLPNWILPIINGSVMKILGG